MVYCVSTTSFAARVRVPRPCGTISSSNGYHDQLEVGVVAVLGIGQHLGERHSVELRADAFDGIVARSRRRRAGHGARSTRAPSTGRACVRSGGWRCDKRIIFNYYKLSNNWPVEICGHFYPTMEAGDISYDPALCVRHPIGQ